MTSANHQTTKDKAPSVCLNAVIALPILIFGSLFCRNLYIEKTLELRTEIPPEILYNATVRPEIFKRKLLRAFDYLADGDGYVSPDKQVRDGMHVEGDSILSVGGDIDVDNDGFTSMREIERRRRRSIVAKDFYNHPTKFALNATSLMAFDYDESGKVTRSEVELGTDRVINEQCPFPKISDSSKLVFLITDSGGQPSLVSVSGVADVTKVSNLFIPEDAPEMYVVANANDPVVWNLSGRVDRIEKFVVLGSYSTNRNIKALDLANVGVIGIPEENISFLSKSCIPNSEPFNYEPKTFGQERLSKMNERLETRVDRPVDIALSEYVLNEVSIPNGYLLDTKAEDPKLRLSIRKKIIASWNNSYFDTDLQNIISPSAPVKYQVLPGKDGIKALVRSGKITRLRHESPAEVYKVNEEIPHYPAGLAWHSYIFVFDVKTPQPEFNPGFEVRVRPF